MNILILLPLANFFLCFLIFYRDRKNTFSTEKSLRWSFLLSLLTMAVQVLLATEILSLFNFVTFEAILIWWLLSFLLMIFLAVKQNTFKNITFPKLINWTKSDKLLLFLLIASLLFLLLNAILTAPNNWDGITYHIARVIHWVQNKNINYYATHIESQISLQAFAEYVILHTFLLTGDDYFANAVQWLSLLGSLVTVSLIAQYLGASIRGQLLSVFLLLTTPIALYEATSIQNDLVATIWVLMSFLFLLKLKENFSFKWAILIGTSMALALLTKSTSYMYLFPIVIYVVFLLAKRKTFKILYAGIIISTLVIVLNAGYYVRNVLLCGSIMYLHEGGVAMPIGKLLEPEVVLSNITKNIAFNFSTPFSTSNHCFDNVIHGLHKLLKVNINDPATSFGIFEIIADNRLYSQDYAANPLQILLFFIMLPFIYIFREKFSKDFFLIFFMGIVGILLIILLLKWQPFSTRFQIPFWAVVAILFAVMADKLAHKKILPLFMGLLWAIGSYYLYFDTNLRFKEKENIFNTSREQINTQIRGEKGELYQKLVEKLVENVRKSQCVKFSLITQNDYWEYYLWKLLCNKGIKPIFKSIQVKNITSVLEDRAFKPCILIQIKDDANSLTFKETYQK